MKALLTRKRIVKGKITRLANLVKSNLSISDELDIYQEQCGIIWKELDQVHEDIMLAYEGEEDLAKQETDYYETVSKLEEIRCLLAKATKDNASKLRINTTESSSSSLNATQLETLSVRLPSIELPTFSGDFHSWLPFRDLFQSTVDENPTIPNVQKLQYLKLSVKPPASILLDSISVTGDNYLTAWKLLCDRYNNEAEIVSATLDKFLNQPTLPQESANGLRKLMDVTSQCIQTLKSLHQPVQHWDTILIHILSKKMDHESQRQWIFSIQDKEKLPNFKDLTNFIDNRARAIASVPQAKQQKSFDKFKPFEKAKSNEYRKSQHSFHVVNKKCDFCNVPRHVIYKCFKFKNLSVEARKNFVKENSLCENCLRSHPGQECSISNCKKCNAAHHSLLHDESTVVSTSGNPDVSQSDISSHFSHNPPNPKMTLMPTAIIEVLDANGQKQPCRALLDSASQTSFVSERCVQRLGIRRQRANILISGLTSSTVCNARGKVKLKISSRHHATFASSVDALILSKVTGTLPQVRVDTHALDCFSHLKLADEHCNEPSYIDILLGADVFGKLLLGGCIASSKTELSAIDTVFGWVITGITSNTKVSENSISSHFIQCDSSFDLQRFWEEVPVQKRLTTEEEKCENHFRSNFHRNGDGRFVVKLPFRDQATLGSSRGMAEKRLVQIEKRLRFKPENKMLYREFLKEYEDLGHMTRVSPPQPIHTVFYLPHHCVFKGEDRSKIRVVFDASAKSSNGLSLNDKLMVGPTLQADIATLLVQFRKFKIAISADIVKMYRQVLVHPDDRNYQRILWRSDATKPLEDYCLNTVTYGTASAPYLATKCLQQLAEDEKMDFPIGSSIVKTSFYVDDLMSGADSLDGALEIYQEVRQLLLRGGFDLRKWSSNETSFLQEIPKELCATCPSLEIKNDLKALGVRWNTSSDSFSFHVPFSIPDATKSATKRSVLSNISKIFDPLGWISPVTVRLKILMQELWKFNINWDQPTPDTLQEKCINMCQDLVHIQHLKNPRYILQQNSLTTELHGFCDASEKAFSAVVYARTVSTTGEVKVQLIASKTRVAPIKLLTLPRLELCGAVLLASLVSFILKALNFDPSQVRCWTDSTIVLAWLSSHPSRWKTFVAHRVNKVHTLIPSVPWCHVISDNNPADCASRGIPAAALTTFDLWWTGPTFLTVAEKVQEHQLHTENADAFAEERKVRSTLTCLTSEKNSFWPEFLQRFSTLTRLKRITAYIFRFLRNCRTTPEKRNLTFLSTQELKDSLNFWIKMVQLEEFGSEISSLKKSNRISTKSKILTLHPFLDSDHILRVGGRLRNSYISADHKHPILLPKDHLLTELIVKHFHVSLLHAGPQLLQACLLQQFWIVATRGTIRRLLGKCVTCIRQRGQSVQQMGDLPPARVNVSRPFSESGVDFAGPFHIRMSKASRAKTCKAYLALFVCFATKAVHCEIASDLSTVTFIAALKRFIARRGKPTSIRSDCGSNFVGADNLLKDILKNQLIGQYLADEGIEWVFNPAYAPHMGGLWESAIKSVKFHLKRIIGDVSLTFEELYTVVVQVEACLNSRPLCPMSNDPNDFSVLTPGHFLVNAPLTALPEPDLTTTPVNRLSRWQLTQRLVQHFWNRWKTEYLSNLQQRPKWHKSSRSLQLGDLVLIKDERLPPLKWKMGRVTELFPGADGLIRIVSLKTADGQFRRHVKKLCLLPVKD